MAAHTPVGGPETVAERMATGIGRASPCRCPPRFQAGGSSLATALCSTGRFAAEAGPPHRTGPAEAA